MSPLFFFGTFVKFNVETMDFRDHAKAQLRDNDEESVRVDENKMFGCQQRSGKLLA